MKKIWIYDLEVFRNLFCALFIDRDSNEERFFVIYKDRDDRKELFKFLKNNVAGLCGYNCNTYDMQILEYLWRYPNCTTFQLRNYSDRITSINQGLPDVPEHEFRIPQLDLFHALSLSVKAKRTSLKWCEVGIDFENVEDMPDVEENEDFLNAVYLYNKNDVLATKALYHKYRYEIDMRKQLSEREGIHLMNSTEPGMAKKLFAKYLCQAMGIKESELKKMGTDRHEVVFKDIILPYIQFQSPELQRVLERFKTEKLTTFDSFNIKFCNLKFEFGLGGLHAFGSSGIYESSDDYIIKTCDVKSYYPNLIIKNQFCPAHLDKNTFLNLYEGFYKERSITPKSDPRNYILKILLNSTYGLTNDQYSFLRDKKVTMQVTINGQLLLAMLSEMLSTIPNSQLLMVNTDGIEIKFPKEYKNQYYILCKQWEELTQLELEHEEYSKIIARDINNYISIYTNGKTKCKGAFEFENIPLHKNKSHSIIPRAVFSYFVNNIPIEETIYNHTNIYDFCAGVRARSADKKGRVWYELHSIENEKKIYSKLDKHKILSNLGYYEVSEDFYRHPDMQGNMDGISIDDFIPKHEFIKKQKLSKTVRYFISKEGKWLFKCYEDGTSAHVEAPLNLGKMKKDWKVTYFNKYYPVDDFKDYNIDYSYYIHKAREWINNIQQKDQLKLF